MAKRVFGIGLVVAALALTGNSVNAGDSDAAPPAPAPAEEAVTSTEVTEEAAPTCTLLPGAGPQFAAVAKAAWHCNCNTNQDCDAICGEKNHTCLIFAVCDNWPDFTGRCSCDKDIQIQPVKPTSQAG